MAGAVAAVAAPVLQLSPALHPGVTHIREEQDQEQEECEEEEGSDEEERRRMGGNGSCD